MKETTQTWQASFQHAYRVDSFLPGGKNRHACLLLGYWCWQNLKEHPTDIIKFIKSKS